MPLPIELMGPPPRDVRRVRSHFRGERRRLWWIAAVVALVAGGITLAVCLRFWNAHIAAAAASAVAALLAWSILRADVHARRLEAQLLEVLREGDAVPAYVLAVEQHGDPVLLYSIKIGFRDADGVPFVGVGSGPGSCVLERGHECTVFVHEGVPVLYVEGGVPVFLRATEKP